MRQEPLVEQTEIGNTTQPNMNHDETGPPNATEHNAGREGGAGDIASSSDGEDDEQAHLTPTTTGSGLRISYYHDHQDFAGWNFRRGQGQD